MTKIDWIKNSRVRTAPSSRAIDALDALIAEQPIISQEKSLTKEKWRAKQMQILAHHPVKPGRIEDLDKKPVFKFRPDDKMFERSVAFARKLDAAHDHATKMNWRFKNNRVRES